MKNKKLISSDQATQSTCQHVSPCSDCPWARDSLNGWLGGVPIDAWLTRAHGNVMVPCHTSIGAQCAGLAIYRRNVVKRVDPPLLQLHEDKVHVFATPMEFREHHSTPLAIPPLCPHGKGFNCKRCY